MNARRVLPLITFLPSQVFISHTESKRRCEAEMNAYREGLRKAEFAKIPGDGYHAAGSAPDERARITLDFLTRNA